MQPCNCSFSFQSHPLIYRASGNEGMEPILSNGMCKAFLFLDVWNHEVISVGTESVKSSTVESGVYEEHKVY